MDRIFPLMGLVEVLARLIELFGIRKRFVSPCLDNPPTPFIGIRIPLIFNMP